MIAVIKAIYSDKDFFKNVLYTVGKESRKYNGQSLLPGLLMICAGGEGWTLAGKRAGLVCQTWLIDLCLFPERCNLHS